MGPVLVLLFVALEIAAFYCAWRAIASARTPQGAVGWVVFLIAAPHFAVPLYLFLGHHRFRGYLIARRESEAVVDGVKRFAAAHAPLTAPEIDPLPFERLAELPAARGNSMRPLIDGAETFDAIFAAIDAADTYILAQFYIVHDDAQGRAFRDRLIAAAARGVEVRFMTDAVGSHKLPEAYFESLRTAGISVVDPKNRRGPRHRFQLNYRNHRKTVVVDGKQAFTGGLNVGNEYMGRDPRFGNWRDTHVELRGPMVAQLQLVFAEDWHWASGEVIIDRLKWDAPLCEDDMTGLVVATGPGDEMETGALMFFSAITAAKKRVWIASPYCIPDTDVLSALKHAALSGLDVRLLLPEVIDHRTPWFAAFAYFDELRAAGVQIWRYDNGFMHQKIILVDDALAGIGTTNLDNRSFRLNFEAMALFFDPRAAEAVESFLEVDFSYAFRLEKTLPEQPRKIRIGAPIARLFAPLL
ncbi:MAG: cardiolipin synthase [Pseudomonadota bacterium]